VQYPDGERVIALSESNWTHV